MPQIDLNQKLTNLYGRPIPKMNPSKEELAELEKYPKIPGRNDTEILDYSKLPDETLGNFLIACLMTYKPTRASDRFIVNIIAESIIESETGIIELKDKYQKFLLEVLDEVTQRTEKKTEKDAKTGKDVEREVNVGAMFSWATTKAKILMGEKPAED